jgi:hypothetical protein
MWHKLIFEINTEEDWNTMRTLQMRLHEEHDTGFDSGGGATYYEWELDWSLEGSKLNAEQILKFVKENAPSLKYEFREYEECTCSEIMEGDNEECPLCHP